MSKVGRESVLYVVSGTPLDTYVIKWLLEHERYSVTVLIVDVGQDGNLHDDAAHLKKLGCDHVFIENARNTFVTDFIYPSIQARCALGVPLSAPCIARTQLEVAQREGIHKVAHGIAGDTQIQLELVYYALNPLIQVVAPLRDTRFLEYLKSTAAGSVPIPTTFNDVDVIRHIETPETLDAPAHFPEGEKELPPEIVKVEFKDGIPVKVTNVTREVELTNPYEIFHHLNEVGSLHGIGRLDHVEDLELGVKGRTVSETPGHAILDALHSDIEGITMDREVMRLRDMLKPKFAALVRGGCRFSPEMDFITAAINKSQELIDGVVTAKLHDGCVVPIARESCRSLFDKELASLAIPDRFDPADTEGFIKIHSLRLRAHHAIVGKHTPRAPSRWPPAVLTLSDGTSFKGRAFGQPISCSGEVVFTTGMVGYTESLTDPSYRGQILVLTYPMIGNYGIPPMSRDRYGLEQHFESFGGKIHVAGLVVSEYCEEPSHWNASYSLSKWLKSQNIPAIMMVDTRALVKKIREHGSLLGKITTNYDVDFVDPNAQNLAAQVSVKQPVVYGNGDLSILCIDMGIKLNTIRLFLKHNVSLKIVPWDWDIKNEEYDGLFISNGPGDPALLQPTIDNVAWALQQDKPIFGICMGNLMVGLAAGCKSYKLKYGNRGQNQPCINHLTKQCIITTQNHGYAIDSNTVPPDWEVFFTNANDKSNEGLRHKTKPFFSVQFHPEARCGPNDSEYLFKDYITAVREFKIQQYIKNRPNKVLILGAGGITIGQAGEFDYSGSQCIKSLKEEGMHTILINPNIATVQTYKGLADEIFSTPITPAHVETVIKKTKPDGILLGFGGQTALNCGLQLQKLGILKKHGVRVLGTSTRAIEISEDREMFAETLKQIGEKLAPSQAVSAVPEAIAAAKQIGYPVMVRAAYALGGLGSGIVDDEESLVPLVQKAFASSPQVLIEKSVKGWKEVEYEVVRDIRDNCITVCNMENLDPMGVHTGESIVVAPSQTLTNDEYHMLRTASIKIIRRLGIVGECNIQYGLDPESMEYIVIEVNARLSRSSALASKATGYPLAHVAAKLALGIELPDVINAVTKGTTACFEPSLDYVVVKIPRWDLSKFNMVSQKIGSVMKSVGEVMAIGRSFQEALQKALRMVDTSYIGCEGRSFDNLRDEIENPTPHRIFAIAQALKDISVEEVHSWSKIDCWFLEKIKDIINLGKYIEENYKDNLHHIPHSTMWEMKAMGFADIQIAKHVGCTETEVREHRLSLGVKPFIKQIDTVAGEFPADTNANYLYVTYNASFDDIAPKERPIMVLGSGVYRIGSSVEFDFTAVMALRKLRALGHPVVMVNTNPETVSTDYDESNRLYFDELSLERILDICGKENPKGIIISVGGQAAQNLALPLHKLGLPVMGTHAERIDEAEDRGKFSALCDEIKLDQPPWSAVTSLQQAQAFCDSVKYPVLIRPSYVLSGSGMSVVWSKADLTKLLQEATDVSRDHPVVITKYYTNAKELDVDVVAFKGELKCWAICEHLENAGVHSGDATMALPPVTLTESDINLIRNTTERLAARLQVAGPMNVQYLWFPNHTLKIIEANVRSSRSVPFVTKTTCVDFPMKMVEVLLANADGSEVEAVDMKGLALPWMGIKVAMFSFLRLAGADPVQGVEMSSTGEVGCYGRNFDDVFLKALLCSGFKMPKKTIFLALETPAHHEMFLESVKLLAGKYDLLGTPDTARYYKEKGIDMGMLYLPKERLHPNYNDAVRKGQIHLVINLRNFELDWQLKTATKDTASNGYWIRRNAVDFAVPLIVDPSLAVHVARVITSLTESSLAIESYREVTEKAA